MLRRVAKIDANFRYAFHLLDGLARVANDRGVIGGGEQNAESHFSVNRCREVAHHSGLENVQAEPVVTHTGERGVDADLQVVGHQRKVTGSADVFGSAAHQ